MERSEDYMAKHFSEVKRELEQPDGHMAGAAASVSQSFMPPGFASGWSATGIYAVPLCFQRWRSAEASALHFFMRKCW